MENIFNFLNNVWLDLKAENKSNFSFVPFLLLVCSIPLPFGIVNAFFGLFMLSVLIKATKNQFKIQLCLVFPILLFLLFSLSILWSIDVSKSIKALPKTAGLFLIPLAFMIMKPFSKEQVLKIIKYYSFSMVLYVFFYLIKATFRYLSSGNQDVFFYHELVTEPVNAIHVSVYVAIAFFYFFNIIRKTSVAIFCAFLLFGFLLLLSSKNIIATFLVLAFLNYLFLLKKHVNRKTELLLVSIAFVVSFLFFGNIKERFNEEFQSNFNQNVEGSTFNRNMQGVNVISIKEAWNNEKFTPNDYFPGTAFRVLQIRFFYELLTEDSILFKGYGLNAAQKKIEEKAIDYNLFQGYENEAGYQSKNFHNQYVQIFAEVGVFGLLFIVTMLFFNIKKTIQTKDFIHFAFAVLMISLFLTESFLSRQRGVLFFTLFFCVFNSLNNMPPKKRSI